MRFCIAHELGHLFLHMLEKNEEGNIELVKDSLCKELRNFNLYEWEAEEILGSGSDAVISYEKNVRNML